MLPDLHDLGELPSPSSLPARSRLYCLEPLELGTGFVESLTSYMARLAEAHSLRLSTFVSKILAPLSKVKGITGISGKHDILRHLAASLNATGETSVDCIRILESLTQRKSLNALTLQYTADCLSNRALVNVAQKWCPLCLREWNKKRATIFYPLLWNLQAVRSCPIHQILLKSQCSCCTKQHHPLEKHMRLGYCPHCSAWLGFHSEGLPKIPNSPIRNAYQFVAEQSERFIASATVLQERGQSFWGRNVSYLLAQYGGVANKLAQQLGINHDTVSCWIKKEHVPTLPSALMVAYAFDLDLVELLSAPLNGEVNLLRPVADPSVSSLFRTKLRRHDETIIRVVLAEAAEYPVTPPLSLTSVCKKAQCDQSFASRKFPDLARKIITHRRNYVQSRKQQRLLFTRLITKSVGSHIAAAGQYPSYRKMKHALPSTISLRDPIAKQVWLELLEESGW